MDVPSGAAAVAEEVSTLRGHPAVLLALAGKPLPSTGRSSARHPSASEGCRMSAEMEEIGAALEIAPTLFPLQVPLIRSNAVPALGTGAEFFALPPSAWWAGPHLGTWTAWGQKGAN